MQIQFCASFLPTGLKLTAKPGQSTTAARQLPGRGSGERGWGSGGVVPGGHTPHGLPSSCVSELGLGRVPAGMAEVMQKT